METLKKLFIFSEKKAFLIFQEKNFSYTSGNRTPPQKYFTFLKKGFLLFRKTKTSYKFLIFEEMDLPSILENPKNLSETKR